MENEGATFPQRHRSAAFRLQNQLSNWGHSVLGVRCLVRRFLQPKGRAPMPPQSSRRKFRKFLFYAIALTVVLIMVVSFELNLAAQPVSLTNSVGSGTNASVRLRRSFAEAESRYRKEPESAEAAWQFARAGYDLADAASSNAERAEI